MTGSRAIIGLGNPGPAYAKTRHNVGFQLIGHLSRRWSIPLKRRLCRSKVGMGVVEGIPVGLATPQTFMNRSGEAVRCLMTRWRLEVGRVLIVCDDLALPLGMIRLKPKGSDGGHRGLSSILEEAGSEDVPRLRIGIGAARVKGEEMTPFVLDRFSALEKKRLEEGLGMAAEACEAWMIQGMPAAMNRFNRRVECPTS